MLSRRAVLGNAYWFQDLSRARVSWISRRRFPGEVSIGNYRVLRKLGQGGMGAVYEAIHEEIGRRAAIKILLPEFAQDQQNILRFFNELRAASCRRRPAGASGQGMFRESRAPSAVRSIVAPRSRSRI